MSVDAVRLPDLWLKRALAYALLSKGEKTFRLTGETLIDCLRGSEGTVFTLNKLIAGDTMAGVGTDLFYFAATMEFLLLNGPEAKFSRETIVQFAAKRRDDLALEGAVLGTFSEFANAALGVLESQKDWSEAQTQAAKIALGRTLRQEIKYKVEKATTVEGKLRLLWGKQRNWALQSDALDRIIRQPANETPEIPEGDFVQIVLPPPPTDQWVFGFEMRMDDDAATRPWIEIGSWFAPRLQRQGEAMALLPEYAEDELNPRAEQLGRLWMQVVGVPTAVGTNQPPALPAELLKLTARRPVDWPVGYAEAMAAITYVDRLGENHRKATAKAERNRTSKFGTKDDVAVPPSPRLYHAEYEVVSG